MDSLDFISYMITLAVGIGVGAIVFYNKGWKAGRSSK